jgi:S1-C subfamily serine protease
MSSTSIRKSALGFLMASLALATPAALAERASKDGLNDLLTNHQTIAACIAPDSKTLNAILPIATDHGSHATGVVYERNRVLTAAHAVAGGDQFFVRVGESYRAADLVMLDHAHDLAVLSVDTQSIRPLHITGIDPIEEQPVWAVGYPRAKSMTTSTGVLQEYYNGALHSSASIDAGQSGGGLLSCRDGSWELLGMLRGFGAYLQGDHYVKIKNHSVSVAAATINEFLNTGHY